MGWNGLLQKNLLGQVLVVEELVGGNAAIGLAQNVQVWQVVAPKPKFNFCHQR
jgi:hypothetical protein